MKHAQSLEEAAANLAARLKRPIQPPPLPEEVKRQRQADAEAARAALQQQKVREHQQWQLETFGIHWDEIDKLGWDDVKPINDGPQAVEILKPMVERWYGMAYLGGASGQAKSLILKIIVAIGARQGQRTHYVDMRDVLQNLRAAYSNQDYQRDGLATRMDRWIEMPILCIDELDKVQSTDWVKEQMFYLIDKRYARAIRQEALTVIAGNHTERELAPYVASRLQDNRGAFIVLNGMDGRQLMSEGNRY